jgi:phosphatidate cytidylyltransferase
MGLAIGFTALFAILFGGIPLVLLCIIIVILGSKEYTKILEHKGFTPSFKIIIISSLIFALIAYFNKFELIPLAFTLSTLMAFMWVLFRGKQPYIANVATTILGFVYCGWFPLHLLLIRDIGCNEPVFNGWIKTNPSMEGAAYAVLLLLAVILTDSFCYYAGMQFGKHKLSEVISPNKTVEGAIGGIVGGICGALLFAVLFDNGRVHLIEYVILALVLSIFSQIGDLASSVVKRRFGVKDFGKILNI